MLMRALLSISFLGCCASSTAQNSARTLGNKSYELSNHLGNVMVVVSDRKIAMSETSNTNLAYNETDIKAFNDYYPYGMVLEGRNDSKEYRFGFQGQEKDDEVKGARNSVNYKYRVHDPRLGRFFAVDPLSYKYPYYSSYQFSGNKTIAFVELEGLEEKPVVDEENELDEECKCLKQEVKPVQNQVKGREVLRWKYKPKKETVTVKMSLGNRIRNLFKRDYGGSKSKRGNVKTEIEHRWYPVYKPILLGPRQISREINNSGTLNGQTTRALNYSSPSDASSSVNYTINYNGWGWKAPNRFVIRDLNGNIITSGGTLKLEQESNNGTFSFSIPANTNFTIEIQGINNPEANDVYEFKLNYTYITR